MNGNWRSTRLIQNRLQPSSHRSLWPSDLGTCLSSNSSLCNRLSCKEITDLPVPQQEKSQSGGKGSVKFICTNGFWMHTLLLSRKGWLHRDVWVTARAPTKVRALSCGKRRLPQWREAVAAMCDEDTSLGQVCHPYNLIRKDWSWLLEWELCPTGLCVWMFGPQLFREVIRPFAHGTYWQTQLLKRENCSK